jgi:hypothetical protein
MRLKSSLFWLIMLLIAFALGYFAMHTYLHRGDSAIQNQDAPQQAPAK